MENAYHNFFSQTGGFPKFKNKDTGNSYKTNNIKSTYKDKIYESIRIDLKNRTITLPKLKDLSIRKRECPKCGCIHDRDINASINIMFEGLKIYMQSLV